jgi:hypothetical protein
MVMVKSTWRLSFVLAGIAAISGCVKETTVGEQHVFTYELWVPVCALLAGIAALPAGWVLRKAWSRGGWTLLILGPLVAVFIAPAVYRDCVILDDRGFAVRTGFWGTPPHEVSFENLRGVRVVDEKSYSRGREHTHDFFVCQMKDGRVAKVPVTDLCETAVPQILKALEEHGIPVERR